jgi:hypothetical protein
MNDLKLRHLEVITEKVIINGNLVIDIRRMKRKYRLREAQINAVTSYNHLGVISMAQRGNGCVSSLKAPWHTRPDDIITTASKIYTPCSHFDYLIDRRMKQSRINIFQLEKFLPENAFIPKIDQPNSLMTMKGSHNRKSYRRIRDLEKAFQV